MRFRKLLCLIPLYLQSIAAADVQLSAHFSDHMVLQRDRPITVWGWGSHPEVPQPVALRYAFSMNPEGANLYNQDGLPASPFRTDDW